MFFMSAASELTLKNAAYKKALQVHVWQAYQMDISGGDVTTRFFVPQKGHIVIAEIIAKESGILAGLLEAKWLLKNVGVTIITNKAEGKPFKKGDVLIALKGRADHLLKIERTLLNLLQRLSGIATATRHLVSKLPPSIKLLATRKTAWGLLDKRAVTVGGGGTHRLNLNDAILVKDNHLTLSSDFTKTLKRILKRAHKVRFVEIELENLIELENFVRIYQNLPMQYHRFHNIVIMLDNFQPSDIKKAIPLLKGTKVAVEVSGGVNGANIKRYAIRGVSAISSSMITAKAPFIDFSMRLRA
jgi:nicotinate-nucleotide pyrophosphorylase (carboxylating)